MFPTRERLKFQKCIHRQVGRVTFHTRPDRSRLVIVDTESQAEAVYPERP